MESTTRRENQDNVEVQRQSSDSVQHETTNQIKAIYSFT